MRRKTITLIVTLVLGAVGLTIAGQASAERALSVSGTYTVASAGTFSCAQVGASGFMIRCNTTGFTTSYSGSLTGTAVADFTQLINCATSRTTGTGTETFTGTIDGVAGLGTLAWIDQFSSDFDCSFFFPFNFAINSVGVTGSGDFAGLQGRLTFTDTTYSGILH